MFTLQETALIGCVLYAARAGETIDAVEVGKNAMPDDDPITNWSNLKCITNCKYNAVEKNFGTKQCFTEDGTLTEEDVKRIIRDELIVSTQNMSSIVDELQYGLSAAPVEDGPAVEAFAEAERKVYYWIWIKGVRVGKGGVAKDLKLWGYFELETAYEFNTGISETALRFTHEKGSVLGAPIQFKSAT